MRNVVLDTGAFVAAERFKPEIGTILAAAAASDSAIYIPLTVIAEIWRATPPRNAEKLIKAAFELVELDLTLAKATGALMGIAGKYQVVDATVAVLAYHLRPAVVFTSDPDDIVRLIHSAGGTARKNRRGRAYADVSVERI